MRYEVKGCTYTYRDDYEKLWGYRAKAQAVSGVYRVELDIATVARAPNIDLQKSSVRFRYSAVGVMRAAPRNYRDERKRKSMGNMRGREKRRTKGLRGVFNATCSLVVRWMTAVARNN